MRAHEAWCDRDDHSDYLDGDCGCWCHGAATALAVVALIVAAFWFVVGVLIASAFGGAA